MNRRRSTTFLTYCLLLGAVLLALAAGCDLPGKPDISNRPVMPDQIVNFETLYASNCAGCHGADGTLGPAPPLNDPLLAAIISKDQVMTVLRAGRAGTPMPPFAIDKGGSLTAEQIQVLADGIKSHWDSGEPPAESPPPYALSENGDGDSLTGSPDKGKAVFTRACAGCHGDGGRGGDGGGAINAPAFLALISNQAIRRIIITGRPDLGMPDFSESYGRTDDFKPLTSAEIDDLVALVASWRATDDVAMTGPK